MYRLDEIRKERGLTQHRLADISGVSRPTIARMETRAKKYVPRAETVQSILDTLGILEVELLSDDAFERRVQSATLDELLTLNRDLSQAAEREGVGTARYRLLFDRVDKVIDRFARVAGPFVAGKPGIGRRARGAAASTEHREDFANRAAG